MRRTGLAAPRMQKVLGLLTEDFRLYHDLVAALKARDLPFVSLSFSRRVPETVGAVLTSPAEAGRIRHGHVVAVDDLDSSIAKALQILKGKASWSELLVGVDPGHEPGVAIIGDGDVIDARIAASPEAVAPHVRQAIRTFPAKEIRVRVGHGDPTNRNRVLNALSRERLHATDAAARRRCRDRDCEDAGATRRAAVRGPPDAGRGPRDPATLATQQRRRRHHLVRAGGGRRPRGSVPR